VPGTQLQPGFGEGGLELAAVVVLARDHEQGLAFVGLRAGQGESDRQPVQDAHQVQPQPQEKRE
jgi:hypothetical protein